MILYYYIIENLIHVSCILNINMGRKPRGYYSSKHPRTQEQRCIHPRIEVVLSDGRVIKRTPSDKQGGREYSKYYMREYRKIRGYLAGRKREKYNAYMRRKMRDYRETPKYKAYVKKAQLQNKLKKKMFPLQPMMR